MLTESEFKELITREVIDRDGKSVGYIETIFNDRETGAPEWIGVFTGTFRHHHCLVPVKGVEKEGTTVRIPWTKEEVHGAPDYGKPEGVISEAMERRAYSHYGLESAAVS
jgi:sporulation protein YlmC with PRC-barrel domain